MKRRHDMPFGVRLTGEGTEFRLWAPAAEKVGVRISGLPTASTTREPGGWFSAILPENLAGRHYTYLINDADDVPDPASRFQPDGPFGPSEIVDPTSYEWHDADWRGRPWHEAILYELHIGTFTRKGTFRAAIGKLDHLADLGVTALEIMPVAEFTGARNWGYDGVDLFAIESSYGRPEDLKALIDAAHARGLMVIQDVVWNHFGPEGNFLGKYAPQFFTDAHKTPWGSAINFDHPGNRAVRDFYRHHALYWLEEFNVDGLRLDAIHAIKDDSDPSIFEEIASALREAAGTRHFHIVAENELNQARLLARDERGRPRIFTAQWDDDFHHPVHVIATGERDGYYIDFADDPIGQLGRALAEGFAYQGDASKFRDGARRGEPSSHLPPVAFVPFIQNHDQIGNRPFGDRLISLADHAALEAATAILLLCPQIPLLFMGEEWGSERPFPFFCEVSAELGEIIRRSRVAEFAIGEKFADRKQLDRIPDPMAESTFESAKLDWESIHQPAHAAWIAFHRRLLTLRRVEIVPLLSRFEGYSGRYEVHEGTVLNVAWRTVDGRLLSLVANLGAERRYDRNTTNDSAIYASHPDAPPGELPPWSVVWRIR